VSLLQTNRPATLSRSGPQPATHADAAPAPVRAPRIYFLPLSMAGPPGQWEATLDTVAAQGFDRLLLSLPDRAGDWSDDLQRIAALCRARGLALLLDVAIDRLPAAHPLVDQQPHWFSADTAGSPTPDPRRPPMRQRSLSFTSETIEPATAWWAQQLRAWCDAGVTGFRCLGLDRTPAEAWRRIAAQLGDSRIDLMAWTPGLERGRLAALQGGPFTHTFSSLAWWDFRAAWFFEEDGALRRVAPPIALVEEPGGTRAAAHWQTAAQASLAQARLAAFAAALGGGWMMPAGFEFGATAPLAADAGEDLRSIAAGAALDLRDAIARANRTVIADPAPPLLLASGRVLAIRTGRRSVVAVNTSLERAGRVPGERLLACELTPAGRGGNLAPGGVNVLPVSPLRRLEAVTLSQDARAAAAALPRIAIEGVTPVVDGGRFAVKRDIGTPVVVEADIFTDGHDVLQAALQWRAADEEEWREVPMRALGNDRWTATFLPERVGRHEFSIAAWRAAFLSMTERVAKKANAGVDVTLDLAETIAHVADVASQRHAPETADQLQGLLARLQAAAPADAVTLLLQPATTALVSTAEPRLFLSRLEPAIPVEVDRRAGAYGAWYEMFPRSQSGDPEQHGTFEDVIERLPAVAAMGFSVLYFPPIHPIGRRNRKGRNNALKAQPGDVGSPYAIGGEDGGHDAIHPELGTLQQFRALVEAAGRHGLEIALDFAIQCSPDHPWLKEHPDWFAWRADGTIRHAENPPKTYEDIVNVEFYAPAAVPAMWEAWRDVVRFWVAQGVHIFRVDNPHTKPLPFWEWLIGEVRGRHPDVIFLSEAFTRPKMMYRLAKLGFTQSYTYFTWRQTRQEFEDYLKELNAPPVADFFRPNFFVNTPDINPPYLHGAPRSAFLIRAALAATLSGLWGMYSGFELCEGAPLPGKEEYLDSEKYQIRAWDWDRPGNIKAEITRLNRIRALHPALQSHLGIRFLACDNPDVLVFSKATPRRDNVLVVAIGMRPEAQMGFRFELPLAAWDLPSDAAIEAEDLWSGDAVVWRGAWQGSYLDTHALPFAIWRVQAPETEA
jgi:starch synthase (maltosyl-transferring)